MRFHPGLRGLWRCVFLKLRFTFFNSKPTYLLKVQDMTRLFGLQWASCQDGLIGLASGTALGAASMVVRHKLQWSSGVLPVDIFSLLGNELSIWFSFTEILSHKCLIAHLLSFWIHPGFSLEYRGYRSKLSSLESYLAHLRNILMMNAQLHPSFAAFK